MYSAFRSLNRIPLSSARTSFGVPEKSMPFFRSRTTAGQQVLARD